MEEHLVFLGGDEDDYSSGDDIDSSDSDSSIEITSTIDENENELVRLSTYLQLDSDDNNDDNNQTFEWPSPPSSLSSNSLDDESPDSQYVFFLYNIS